MNIAALLQPYVADRKLLQEFFENLADQIPNIERDIARLRRAPNDKALIANLFRALHNIKGDASICQVDIGALIAHPIESLLTRLRGGEIEFSPLFAEVILLAMDRLELAVEALIANRSLAHLKLVELVGGLERCSNIPGEDLDAQAVTLIEAVTDFVLPMWKSRSSHVLLPLDVAGSKWRLICGFSACCRSSSKCVRHCSRGAPSACCSLRLIRIRLPASRSIRFNWKLRSICTILA